MTVCSRALVFMEGLCVVIGKEYKQGKRFLPKKKKEGMSSAGRAWGIATLEARRVLENHKCFWDRYWGRAGQLLAIFFLFLVTVPEVFANGNSSHGYYFTHDNRKRKRIFREEKSVFLLERKWFRVYSWVIFTKT